MKIAIMQPYFLPYIGYWQLIRSVDEFVVYDNIEFTKKGWFNRNRILDNGHDRLFTIPIKNDSDFLPVDQRYVSEDAGKEIARTLRIIETNYKKAPYFAEAFPVIQACFMFDNKNLFMYIHNSIKLICEYLGIDTNIVVSSSIDIDHSLKGTQKVMAIAKAEGADVYINAIGGQELYNKQDFSDVGLELKFIKTMPISYKQFSDAFVAGLSIIDVMMFNSKSEINEMLERYELV